MISSLSDIHSLSCEELTQLAGEMRETILQVLSKNGGHLASNLGIVELTLALHKVFDSPNDKFLFDTGHQTYPHKLLTGRGELFSKLRQYKGLCGFSHPMESPHDHSYSGHAGTAFSLALGMAKRRDLLGDSYHILPILGDATLTCGVTLEALNQIPQTLRNFIIVLNDNQMAISQNVGNIKSILKRFLRDTSLNERRNELFLEMEKKISTIFQNGSKSADFFEQFGIFYLGPIDGHDLKKLIEVFSFLKSRDLSIPVLVHALTIKGKGMEKACQNPTPYHGVKSFDRSSGKIFAEGSKATFPQIFGKQLVCMGEKFSNLYALSPAMIEGAHLTEFMEKFPDRCLDLGIAEEHCVTYAGGLAYQKNCKVVVSIYATFLQRAFDQVFHDVCLQEFPVIFAIDRAGLNGPDGVSHHGIYDISFLATLPGLILAQPRDGRVLKELLESAVTWERPVAIRYPNRETTDEAAFFPRILGKGEVLQKGKDLLILPLGDCCKCAFEISLLLKPLGIVPTILDPVFLKPLDEELFEEQFPLHSFVVTIEEHSLIHGFGSMINSWMVQKNIRAKVLNFGIPDLFVQHGDNFALKKELGLDCQNIFEKILKTFYEGCRGDSYDDSTLSE